MGIGGRSTGVRGRLAWKDNAVAQSLALGTPEKIVGSNTGIDPLQSRGTVSDLAANQMIAKREDVYIICAYLSIKVSVGNVVLRASIWVDGSESELVSEVKLINSNDMQVLPLGGPLFVPLNGEVDLRFTSDKNTDVTVVHGQVWASSQT